jgi:hypothetical protein
VTIPEICTKPDFGELIPGPAHPTPIAKGIVETADTSEGVHAEIHACFMYSIEQKCIRIASSAIVGQSHLPDLEGAVWASALSFFGRLIWPEAWRTSPGTPG